MGKVGSRDYVYAPNPKWSDRAEITRVRYHGGMQSFLVPPAFYLLPLLLTQTLSGSALLDALRNGGYVIVMRHASSPREAPDKSVANPDNVNLERQLDEAGRSSAVAMGTAIRQLKIPIGEVFTSPTYRAMETVRLARLSNPLAQSELGDAGQSMQAASDTQAAWLKDRVSRVSAATNTVMASSTQNNVTSGLPSEFVAFTPNSTTAGNYRLVIRRVAGFAPRLKWINNDNGAGSIGAAGGAGCLRKAESGRAL